MPRSSGSATGSRGVDAQAFIDGLARMAAERPSRCSRPSARRRWRSPGAENAAGAAHASGSCGPSRTGATPAPCGRSTSRTCRSPTRASPSRPARPRPTARFDLPIEVRNAIARIEILGEGSAGAVTLLDERGKRRRVGLVFGGTADQAQPLLAPTYYIARALAPLRRGPRGPGRRRRRGRASSSTSRSRSWSSPMSAASTARRSTGSPPSSRGAACSCASPARGLPPATTISCRCACAAAAAASAAPCPGTRRAPSRRSPARARSSGSPVAGRDRHPPPDPRGARRRPRREDLGVPRRRHPDRHRRQARRGPDRAVPRHRRHDLVEPAAVGPVRRHAAPHRRRSPARRTTSAPRRATPTPRRSRRAWRSTASAPSSRRRPTARAVPRDYAERATDEHPPGFYGPVDSASPSTRSCRPTGSRPLDFAPLNAPRRAARRRARRSTCARRSSPLALILLLARHPRLALAQRPPGEPFGRLRRAGAAAAIAARRSRSLAAVPRAQALRAGRRRRRAAEAIAGGARDPARLCGHGRRPGRRDAARPGSPA